MRKAFTLIELLVVIAIIAILAAILFPVFAQAKLAAKKAAALSNSKQLGIGVMIYAGDYDDNYPLTYSVNAGSPWAANTMPTGPVTGFSNVNTWADLVYPYSKNKDIFTSPARPNAGKEQYAWCWWCNNFNVPKMAFGMNPPANYYREPGVFDYGGYNMSTFTEPASKVFLTEVYNGIPDFAIWWFTGWSAMGRDTNNASRENGGRLHYVFADGHAKALKPLQTIRPSLMWNSSDQYPYAINYSPWEYGTSEADAQQKIISKLDLNRYKDL